MEPREWLARYCAYVLNGTYFFPGYRTARIRRDPDGTEEYIETDHGTVPHGRYGDVGDALAWLLGRPTGETPDRALFAMRTFDPRSMHFRYTLRMNNDSAGIHVEVSGCFDPLARIVSDLIGGLYDDAPIFKDWMRQYVSENF